MIDRIKQFEQDHITACIVIVSFVFVGNLVAALVKALG